MKAGGNLLAIGLDGAEAGAFLPFKIETRTAEHIAAYFEPASRNSLLAGIGPADVHNRDPRQMPLVIGGVASTGDGVLAKASSAQRRFLPDRSLGLRSYQTDEPQADVSPRLVPGRPPGGEHGDCWPDADLDAVPPTQEATGDERRWLEGLYLDTPEEWDDPYRFFRW